MLLLVGMLPVLTLVILRLQLARPDYDIARLPTGVLVSFMYTGILPLNFSMGMAALSFASEFESGTIVPLLAAPVRTSAIFAGKLLAALAAGIGLAWFSQGLLFGLFSPILNRPWPVPSSVTLLMAAGVPVLAFPLVAMTMVLGSRARQARTAQANSTLAFLAVLAVSLLIAWRRPPLTPPVVAAAALGGLAGGAVLLAVGMRLWDREELLSRSD